MRVQIDPKFMACGKVWVGWGATVSVANRVVSGVTGAPIITPHLEEPGLSGSSIYLVIGNHGAIVGFLLGRKRISLLGATLRELTRSVDPWQRRRRPPRRRLRPHLRR